MMIRTFHNEILIGEICRLLSQGKSVKLRAKGNSMRPFIHGNKDILVLTPCASPDKGDVVLARIEQTRYVVHRIIDISDGRVILMGDNNLYEKEACRREDIYGIVELVIRNGKERNLLSSSSRIRAMAWREMLPLRQLWVKLLSSIRDYFNRND